MQSKYLYPKIHDDIVLEFCNKCKRLNYINNDSFKSMKWYWSEVAWAGTFKNDILVSLSGIHAFPEINKNAFRVMFRGVTLPGVSSKFLNFEQLPLNQEWAYLKNKNAEFYVTFNVNPHIGIKGNLLKVMKRMRKLEYVKTINYFNVKQEVFALL